MKTPFFISCDWGTSSFRIRLVDTTTKAISGELSTSQGIAATFQEFKQLFANKIFSNKERIDYYLYYLASQIKILETQVNISLKHMPVVISGMASATIGMIELPYATLPFELSGTNAITHRIPSSNDILETDVLIISGLRSELDVMRGEETQIIGLATIFPLKDAICIFPGTHSKHIYITDGQITGFRTYMTGELFNTLSLHTILQASVEKPDDMAQDLFEKGFKQGVQATIQTDNLLHTLFTVRTGELFKIRNKHENYYYLSGLLIGKEMHDLLNTSDSGIVLCSSSHLLPFYQTAIEQLGLSNKTSILDSVIIDTIVINGQYQFLQRQYGLQN